MRFKSSLDIAIGDYSIRSVGALEWEITDTLEVSLRSPLIGFLGRDPRRRSLQVGQVLHLEVDDYPYKIANFSEGMIECLVDVYHKRHPFVLSDFLRKPVSSPGLFMPGGGRPLVHTLRGSF